MGETIIDIIVATLCVNFKFQHWTFIYIDETHREFYSLPSSPTLHHDAS